MTDCNLAITLLLQEHFDAVWNIFTAVFPAKYGEEFFDAWSDRNKGLSYGVFDSSKTLRGFVITKHKDAKTQHIEFLGVDPTCQKGGIGTILLTRVLDTCLRLGRRITLIPINDSRVINWYKKYGFVAIGQPFFSPYTGDLEQLMKHSSTHNPKSDPSPKIGIEECQTLDLTFVLPPDTQPVEVFQEGQESLRLLTA